MRLNCLPILRILLHCYAKFQEWNRTIIYPLPPHRANYLNLLTWNFKIWVHFYNCSRQSTGNALPIVIYISEAQFDNKSPYRGKLQFKNKWCHGKSSLNNCHLSTAFYEQDSAEGPLTEPTLSILTASLWCQYYYYPHFKDKDILIIYGRAEIFHE